MKGEQTMKRYEVEITDYVTHATYPIDTVTAADEYTAEQYIADCNENADPDYIELLHTGLVTLTEIE